MRLYTRSPWVALLVAVASLGLAGAAASQAAGPPEGKAANVMNVKDEGHLHLVSNSGSTLVEEGSVLGTLPGKVRVNFDVGPTVYASFTIYVQSGGSISGRGHGALHSTSAYSTFGGTLYVTHGTGRYAHAHGTGGLYGAINRKNNNFPMTVQTIGKLYY